MDAWKGKLVQVDKYRWRIPKDYKPGMLVDGMIYASKRMIETIIQDQAPEQVANVAFLPGIVGHSLAMPDIHWGYGFPIGGVAAVDSEEGVISPGGVGYDINCLSGSTRVLHAHGYYHTLETMEAGWQEACVRCQAFSEGCSTGAPVAAYLKVRPRNAVYRLTTGAGDEVVATAEHPFFTPDGMKPLEQLQPGERVALYPFEGVPYESPSSEILLDEQGVITTLDALGKGARGHATAQVLRQLHKLNLLPLRRDHSALPFLLKVMGYLFGDGTLSFTNATGKGVAWFYGKPEDLEAIRSDIEKIGFTPSRIYRRRREHTVRLPHRETVFEAEEVSFKVVGSAFAVLMAALGVPVGNKAKQAYSVPDWVKASPLWQMRLFLASLSGAEMSMPCCVPGHGYNFQAPTLSLSKRLNVAGSGQTFMQAVAGMLEAFGVRVQAIAYTEESFNRHGDCSARFKLIVSPTTENLIRFWSRVGFEYHAARQVKANAAVQYLKYKQRIVLQREDAARQAVDLYAQGYSPGQIAQALQEKGVNRRFVERAIYEPRERISRVPKGFPMFEEYCKQATTGLRQSGMVWDVVRSMEPVDYRESYVYDLTVCHSDHNFVANGFVVSNCGVRMLRTDLTEKQVRPKLTELVNQLFRDVPAGFGGAGQIRLVREDLREVMVKGAGWMVEHGYGWEEDLTHSEANGCLPGAVPETVSSRAMERGKDQLGTLGGGNHFLEVQVVDEIFDEQAAEAMGITQVGQITIMIHTGSRGFGHQTCQDHLDIMEEAHRRHGIRLPDRQLACAPLKSEEGKTYLAAMTCAANFAFANRQAIAHWTRQAFAKVFGGTPESLGISQIYDVAHNIAKMENHAVAGENLKVCVHRKGATRAFPAGHSDVPKAYQEIGQPVLIPGDMGRYSYLLVGTQKAMEETFGTTCHGAGRMMSRKGALREAKGRNIAEEMAELGIVVRAQNKATLAEEASYAYKDVADVVKVVDAAGIARKVAKLRPIGVMKG
jgi:tRNA-splicing ligase RtcB